MAIIKYDIVKLSKIDGFEAMDAVRNFASHQNYYDKLTDFTKNARSYLRAYTPSVVIYSDDVRHEFLDELENTQLALAALGATAASDWLKSLENSVYKNDAGILSDGLIKFYADMNILAKDIEAARAPEDSDASAAAENPLIFAIDDKPEILATITDMLESDYKVIAMTSGTAALKALEMHAPSLFLLDIEMPVMTGYELAKEIRTKKGFEKTPILFLTGNSSRDAVLAAREHGGSGYILKPVEKDTLLNKIKPYLTKRG